MKKLDVIVNVVTVAVFMGALLWADLNSRPYHSSAYSDIRLTELESDPVIMLNPLQGKTGISVGGVEAQVGIDSMQDSRAPEAARTPEFRERFTALYIDLIDEEFQAAYNNCIIFIYFESGWENVFYIEDSVVEIVPFREAFPNETRCSTLDGEGYLLRDDVEYLYFLIGDTHAPGRHYVGLVVDALTDQVVGYVPAE